MQDYSPGEKRVQKTENHNEPIIDDWKLLQGTLSLTTIVFILTRMRRDSWIILCLNLQVKNVTLTQPNFKQSFPSDWKYTPFMTHEVQNRTKNIHFQSYE